MFDTGKCDMCDTGKCDMCDTGKSDMCDTGKCDHCGVQAGMESLCTYLNVQTPPEEITPSGPLTPYGTVCFILWDQYY